MVAVVVPQQNGKMTKISNEKRIVLKIPIQESSLLHDITKAAARLCVLVCNPFARERWYILDTLDTLDWLDTFNWFRVTQFRGSGLRVQERQ